MRLSCMASLIYWTVKKYYDKIRKTILDEEMVHKKSMIKKIFSKEMGEDEICF